jgi:hypothetical protein
MDNQSKGGAHGRSQHDVTSRSNTAERSSAQNPQYVEVTAFVTRDFPDRGFAFATAKINGRETDIFVGKRGCAKKVKGQWQKLPEDRQYVPGAQDEICARVRLENEPGKKPSAVLWEILPDLYAWHDEREVEEAIAEGLRYLAEHEAECDGCPYCNPSSFRPEY